MGCCGGRNRDDDIANVRAEQKWDYINLQDFKSRSCWTPFSYVLLYFTVLISISVYGVDTFTAINLLAFSRWPSQVKPFIEIGISKWIFAGCIILSFVLLVYRWLRAIRVMKSGHIAQSYLDPIAVRVQSIRMGKRGQGWRRFLVFADLTKSKKGADYVALFTYFNFEAWLRLCLADGPRQVINALTLYEYSQTEVLPTGENAADESTSDLEQFFINIGNLAQKDRQQAVILFAMLFTVIIFVFSALSLLVSLVLYLLFLWHHIPSEDGSLKEYCRRKINTRLKRIVNERVDKALAKGVALQDWNRTDPEDGGIQPAKRQPTLPTLDDNASEQSAPPPLPSKDPFSLSRQTTDTTLPPYSRPSTSNADTKGDLDRQPTLPDLNAEKDQKMGGSAPFARVSDDSSPLVSNAGGFGHSAPGKYEPDPPPVPPIDRPGTPPSLQSGPRPPTSQGRRTPGPVAGGADGYGPRSGHPRPAPPPSAAGFRPPGSPGPNRSFTPGYGPNGPHRPPPPGSSPGPNAHRNFGRPPYGHPGPNGQGRPPPPPRMGTAPPPRRPSRDAPPYNNQF